MEPISLHAEHARKCLKVEYLGGIEYDFQKSRVTGPWDHMISVSAKKVKTKISCLCTFKEPEFVRSLRNRFQIRLSYRPARLHRLAESIPGLLIRLHTRALIKSPPLQDVSPKGTEKRPKVAGLKEVVFSL